MTNMIPSNLQAAINEILRRFMEEELLCLILAGGRGSRLHELTNNDSKPAVQLGKNRIIDFTISNVRNSGFIKRSYVLTQYKSQNLQRHIGNLGTISRFWDRFFEVLPAQQQMSDNWYAGNADAVYQNHALISADRAEHVIILAADHVYKLDISKYYAYHLENDADVTICGRFMPTEVAAGDFGVMELTEDMLVTDFEEKPENPKGHASRPSECFGSMGIYIFKKDVLLEALANDHITRKSDHDFGKNIIPTLIKRKMRVVAYDHETNTIPGETGTYWRDVGNLDAYHATNMDLIGFTPVLNLFNHQWPIITASDFLPPHKLMMTDDHTAKGRLRFMAAGGTVITNPQVLDDVVIGRNVIIDKGADFHRTVLLDDVTVGLGARIIETVVAPNVSIPSGCIIGESIDDDRARNIRVTDKGVRLVHLGSTL